jgi:hypothetical protein
MVRLSLAAALLLASSPSLHAEILEFEFSGSLLFARGPDTEQFGSSVVGSMTLDFAASPDLVDPYDDGRREGEVARWSGFTIDAASDAGFATGSTIDGGTTYLFIDDHLDRGEPYRNGTIYNFAPSENGNRQVLLTATHNDGADGVAALSDWDPPGGDEVYIIFRSWDAAGNLSDAFYSLDHYALVAENIIVGGIDTGIPDFEYNGATVTSLIEELSLEARKHRHFVNAVHQLALELWKAGLISKDERKLLREAAENANLGD